jgi:hypothetical protein
MLYVSCTHNLYDGDVIANKWYPATEVEGGFFFFTDEVGVELFSSKKKCAHFDDVPGAKWLFKYED